MERKFLSLDVFVQYIAFVSFSR